MAETALVWLASNQGKLTRAERARFEGPLSNRFAFLDKFSAGLMHPY